jgi:hypothetical protein
MGHKTGVKIKQILKIKLTAIDERYTNIGGDSAYNEDESLPELHA